MDYLKLNKLKPTFVQPSLKVYQATEKKIYIKLNKTIFKYVIQEQFKYCTNKITNTLQNIKFIKNNIRCFAKNSNYNLPSFGNYKRIELIKKLLTYNLGARFLNDFLTQQSQ